MPARRGTHRMNPELRKGVDAALRTMQHLADFHNVRFVILHGSAAEERMTPDSDIDLLRIL